MGCSSPITIIPLSDVWHAWHVVYLGSVLSSLQNCTARLRRAFSSAKYDSSLKYCSKIRLIARVIISIGSSRAILDVTRRTLLREFGYKLLRLLSRCFNQLTLYFKQTKCKQFLLVSKVTRMHE